MTGLQESLFAVSSGGGCRDRYNEQFRCVLRGTLNFDAMRQAWSDLFERHDALRTAFLRSREGVAVQAVLRARTPVFQIADPITDDEIAELARREHACAFDLTRDSLLRVILVPQGRARTVLIVTFHHLIMDAWSGPLLMDDLMALYAHRCGSAPAVSPPPRASIGQFADAQKKRRGAAASAYWREKLLGSRIAGIPPSDPARPRGTVGFLNRVFPAAFSDQLERFARAEGITTGAVLHAIWGVVLAHLNDADDVVFAALLANRGHDMPGIDRVIGLFAATLPVRADLRNDASFAALSRDIQNQIRGAALWSGPPLSEILAAADLRADQIDHTMVGRPAALAWGDADSMHFPHAGLSVEEYQGTTRDHYDSQISFSLGARSDIEMRHDSNRFPAPRAALLLDMFFDFGTRMMSAPTEPLRAMALCDKAPFAARIETLPVPPEATTLADRLLIQPGENPMLSDQNGMLSRTEAVQAAQDLAQELRAQGVGPGHRVAVRAAHGRAFTIRALACWLCGAAFVPVHPAWPEARQRKILTAIRPAAMLGLSFEPGPHAQNPAVDEAGLAYIIFTSGSTGIPKGVAVPHSALNNYVESAATRLGLLPTDRAMQVTSPAFDLGYTTAFAVLAAGGAVAWMTETSVLDPDAVLRRMASEATTVVKTTPAFLRVLLDAPDPNLFSELTAWRLLVLGGETPDAGQIARLAALCPWLELALHYGPSETTIGCAMTAPSPIAGWLDAEQDALACLGQPVAGTAIQILGQHGDSLPRGVRGEIVVTGAALARGYLDTGPNEGFGQIGDMHSYRTGDIGWIEPDGQLIFAGRRDGIGKIRGQRVDPEQTRLALLALDQVADAAVALHGEGDAVQLVAFVCVDGPERDPAHLRALLAEELPPVQIPGRFVFLSRLLLTGSGKVDLRNMLDAMPPPVEPSDHCTAPHSATEKMLAAAWARSLGLETVAREGDFFLLGGHSIRAMEIAARVQREGGPHIPLRWFIETPVLADLAARIDAAQVNGQTPGQTDDEDAPAVLRLRGGDGPARILCMPGPMGGSALFLEWLDILAPYVPVDGLDDVAELDHQPSITSAAEWILSQTPNNGLGYDVLIGWDFGADLAHAAAAALEARGRRPLVVLLDSVPTEPAPSIAPDRALNVQRYWSRALAIQAQSLQTSDAAVQRFARRQAMRKAYNPIAPLAAPVVSVLASVEGEPDPARRKAAARLSGHLRKVIATSGDHFSLFHPPHVAVWTKALRPLVEVHLHPHRNDVNEGFAPGDQGKIST